MTERVKDEEFLLNYKKSEPEDRFFIIYNNYVSFPKLIKKIEKKLQYIINAEKEFVRNQHRGELGVRIQTSNLSNITAEVAISNVMLEDSFKTGKFDPEALKGVEDAAKYEEYIRILKLMRMDYELIEEIVGALDPEDYKTFKATRIEGKLLRDIAKSNDRTLICIKKRVAKIRDEIKEEAIECMELVSGRDER